MKVVFILNLLLFITIFSFAQSKTKLVAGNINVEVENSTTVKINFQGKEQLFVANWEVYDTGNIIRSRLYELNGNTIKIIKNSLYVVDDSNFYAVLPTTNYSVALIGIGIRNGILYQYKNIDGTHNPIIFASPSLLVSRENKSFQFVGISEVLYHEYGDTSSKAYANITVVSSYCCGAFYQYMFFPLAIDDRNIDIYKNEQYTYQSIFRDKNIMNPLYFLKLKQPD